MCNENLDRSKDMGDFLDTYDRIYNLPKSCVKPYELSHDDAFLIHLTSNSDKPLRFPVVEFVGEDRVQEWDSLWVMVRYNTGVDNSYVLDIANMYDSLSIYLWQYFARLMLIQDEGVQVVIDDYKVYEDLSDKSDEILSIFKNTFGEDFEWSKPLTTLPTIALHHKHRNRLLDFIERYSRTPEEAIQKYLTFKPEVPLKLYHLINHVNTDWSYHLEAVVVAHDEEEARYIHPLYGSEYDNSLNRFTEDKFEEDWCKPEELEVVFLGTASDEFAVKEVISYVYNEG